MGATMNYAAGTPVGGNQVPLYNSPPPFKAVARHYTENGLVSSVVTLSENTTAVEVTAVGSPVVIRWVPTTDTNASVVGSVQGALNFDHAITTAENKRFVVPIERQYTGVPGSMVGGNIGNGLFRRLAFKTQTLGSVLVAEYGSSSSY